MMAASDSRLDISSVHHKLSYLLRDLAAVDVANERAIHGLSMDHRNTAPGDLFLACPGTHTHGRNFIDAAINAGAVAVAYEADALFPTPVAPTHVSVPLFEIAQLHEKVGMIAERFYHHPTRDLFVIGVTGTNGKTSVCQFLAQALTSTAPNTTATVCGVIGTLGNGLYGNLSAALHTTPDALTLHALLDDMRSAGARYVAMETSSHGLAQGRVSGVAFDVAIFTNLSRDHLDYHGTMAIYAQAKQRLFLMPGLSYAVINVDDPYGHELLHALPAGVQSLSYGFDCTEPGQTASVVDGGVVPLSTLLCVRGSNLQLAGNGLQMDVSTPWGDGHLQSSLLGGFNASNLLAALATLLLIGMPLSEALQRLARSKALPGRMECFGGGPKQPLVVVDYAHTPDALTQVLATLREHLTRGAKLWCVFGCGGERDRGKRPLMGSAAEQGADYVVVTDDNPRGEDARDIITDILTGMRNPDGVYVERERAKALAFAISRAHRGDAVLIAGKGHEDYQQIGAQKLPFSDRQQVAQLLVKAAL